MSSKKDLPSRRHALAVATLAALSLGIGTPALAGRVELSALSSETSFDQFIVKYRDDTATVTGKAALKSSLDQAAQSLPAVAGRPLVITPSRRLAIGAEVFRTDRRLDRKEAELLMRRLAADPSVEYVEIDARMQAFLSPDDPNFAQQWGYTDADAGIKADQAWDRSSGQGVVVAVLDTGITNHSDLNANLLPGYDFISNATTARDGNGRDSNPNDEGDWATANGCYTGSPATNSSWHGTHVAGTVAAVTNNAKGVAGTAFNAKVVPIRVLGTCGGTLSDIADAIVWASGGSVSGVPANPHPAEVINMSLGGSGACGSTYQNAINSAISRGTTVIVAAGNGNIDASNARPANCGNVIAVAAVDRNGARSVWNASQQSNYGSTVDVAAPGSDILSTLNTGTTTPGNESYAYYNGTSMATPHVAGVVALIQAAAAAPKSPADIEAILKNTASPFPATPDRAIGSGIVNAKAAVDAVAQATPNLYAISRLGGSATTEVHRLNGSDGYQTFLSQQATALEQTGNTPSWAFAVADDNGDGKNDLYAIKKQAATTEIHVLNGANGYQSFIEQQTSALEPTGADARWVFLVGDYNHDGRPDVYAIKKQATGSATTEVHVLDGADGYKSFLLQSATALEQTGTDESWAFGLGDYNGDGTTDLYAIRKQGGGSGTTEVHVLNGANGYQSFLGHHATALAQVGSDASWAINVGDHNHDGKPDIYAITKQGGGSGKTEVHVLNGADGYQSFLTHQATALHQTGSDHAWELLVANP